MIIGDKLRGALEAGDEVELHVAWPNKKRKTGMLLALKINDGNFFVPELSGIKSMIFVKRIYAIGSGVFGIPMLFAGGIGLAFFWLAWIFWKEVDYLKFCRTYLVNIKDAFTC